MDAAKIKKILVISLSNVGDTVLTTPVVSLLRQRFPSSRLSVLVGPKGAPLFANSRTVDDVITFDKSIPWFKKLLLILDLRKQQFDFVADLRNTAIPAMLQPRYRTSFFVDRSSVSMRQKHLDQLRSLFPMEPCTNQFDFFSEAEKRSAFGTLSAHLDGSKPDGFVIVAPGAGSELKRWTLSGFAEIIQYFQERGKPVVLVGDERETELGIQLERGASKPLANLVSLLTLRELAGLIDEAALVVANDSAVMHLAHELERPTVSIFGPTNEYKYGQTGRDRTVVRLHLDCTPCELAQCRLERRVCLDDLPAASVIQACEALLIHAPH